jgi:hypothetical protein
MGFTSGTRQITRAVSDGTGLTEEEIGVLVVAAALVTALLAFLRAVTAVVEALPIPRSRAAGWEHTRR